MSKMEVVAEILEHHTVREIQNSLVHKSGD